MSAPLHDAPTLTARLLEEVRSRMSGAGADSRRLFHGRGGTFAGLESLSVDWHPPVTLITVHHERVEPLLDALTDVLVDGLGARLSGVLVQRRHRAGARWEVVWGSVPTEVFAQEAGQTFRLDLGGNQNIGFFGDMGEGRALVRRLAEGRSVLNLFAYTCSFSVAALAGDAQRVVNVDMSRSALGVGRRNHLDNGLDPRRSSFVAHDIFKSFSKLRRLGPYDLVVSDPPTGQGRSFSVERDYGRLVRHLGSMLAPGADIVACLNSPRHPSGFLEDLFAEHLPSARLVAVLGAGESFPERGLKILHYRRA